jgi:hypothetical protein
VFDLFVHNLCSRRNTVNCTHVMMAGLKMITMMKPAGCFGFVLETDVIFVEEVIQYCSPTAPMVFHKKVRLIAEKSG